MRWYDLFALTYDAQLESLYRPWRERAVEALGLEPGHAVLDLACGTGQNLDLLVEGVGPEGCVLGVDLSAGMLRRAHRRVEKAGWGQVALVEADATELGPEMLRSCVEREQVDRVICTVGLSAIPVFEQVVASAWEVLAPGGRLVIMDVIARERTLQTRMVELLARADLSAEVWRPLEGLADDFAWEDLGAPASAFGGTLYVARGDKAAA